LCQLCQFRIFWHLALPRKLLVGWLIMLVIFPFQLVYPTHCLNVTQKRRAPTIWFLLAILPALSQHIACLRSSRGPLTLFVERLGYVPAPTVHLLISLAIFSTPLDPSLCFPFTLVHFRYP
jgi:hypothetical protein